MTADVYAVIFVYADESLRYDHGAANRRQAHCFQRAPDAAAGSVGHVDDYVCGIMDL